MRLAAPYAKDQGPPIVRHRALHGSHRHGWHESPWRIGWHRRLSARRVSGFLAMLCAVASVPVSWFILLAGVGLPHVSTEPHRVVPPPITSSVAPPVGPTLAPTDASSPSVSPTKQRPAPPVAAPEPRPAIPTRSASPSPSCPPTMKRPTGR